MNKFNRKQPIHTSGKNITRPNMALTVRQINQRFVQGKSIPQAKQPIHEPKLDIGKNPMRRPYCDIVDVAEFNSTLETKLNESTKLYTEKQKEFIQKSQEHRKKQYDSLVEGLTKKLSPNQSS